MYKNIMLKISGESLAGSNEQGFDFNILNDLASSIKTLQSKNLIMREQMETYLN